MKNIIVVIFIILCSRIICYSQISNNKSHAQSDFIKFIKLPSGISRSDLSSADEKLKSDLYEYAKSQLDNFPIDSITQYLDLIIVYTDENNIPILPDAEKTKSNFQNKILNELTFTFNSPSQPWSTAEQVALTTMLNDFYPKAKEIIGNPLFNITLNVKKDTTISYAGLYFNWLNEMVVKDTTHQTTICHEMIHAFRDDYIMGHGTYEEGMTRAAEAEVFNQLPNYNSGEEFHSYTYDIYYDGLNRPNIATRNGDMWSNMTLVLLRYQLGGYMWAKPFLEDNNFLKNFNSLLFTNTQSDGSTLYDPVKLQSIVIGVKSTIEYLPTVTWMARQHLLNYNPPGGYFLYQRMNQFTLDYFHRDSSTLALEQPQNNATLYWKVFKHNNVLADSGNGITGSYGWINFYANISASYNGKIKIIESVQSPGGLITDTIFRNWHWSQEQGIFGVVEDANTGTVAITPLDTSMAPLTQNIVNGTFSFPTLENLRGRFRYDFTYNSCQHVSRVFTKDASKYFLSIRKDPNYTNSMAVIYSYGQTNFCTGESITLSTTPGQGFTYQWKKNGINISGATASAYTITSTGTYKVVVTNPNGCSKTSTGVLVTGPPNTTITVTGSLTICPPDSVKLSVPLAAGSLYQWKKNNLNISGATSQIYYAKDSGDYKVKVTNNFGCSKTSGIKKVIIGCPSARLYQSDDIFSIRPNPNTGQFTLQFNSDEKQKNSIIEIYNSLGQSVYQNSIEIKEGKNQKEINLSKFPSGIYFLNLKTDKKIFRQKIIKE